MLTNRPEFHVVDTATMHLGAIPFSMYNTASTEQIAYLLRDSGSRVVVCERQFLEHIRAAGGPVEHIVVADADVEGTLTLEQLEAQADPAFDFDAAWRAVSPGDVVTLIYTSGTTGDPKGVELTHANVLAEINMVTGQYGMRAGGRCVSYFPMAHIGERGQSQYLAIMYRMQVTTVADPRAIAAALPDAKPTFLFTVPRVLEKLKAALEQEVAKGDGPRARLLRLALDLGQKRVRADAAGTRLSFLEAAALKILDRAVLSKVRARLKLSEVRRVLSGAASIAPETLEYFMALGITISETWGMSETTGPATGNPLDRVKVGTVGVPFPGVKLRIADDGEVLLHGPIVMRGYRNDPKRTAEALDADGWLHTGDIAVVDDDGYVTIVDRKKELIINAAGKNMSPSNIENAAMSACSLLGQVVAIGDGRPHVTALVVLDADAAATWAAQSLSESTPAALAESPALIAVVAEAISAGNRRLSRAEQIKRFRILPEFWEPGGEEVTATMKLRRRPVRAKYSAEIDEMYAPMLPPNVYEPTE
jgi:long-chain acyl-CoA synthetase